ncbi:hypothetical protein D805_0156 [Bifidobacterium thermophilum RBL67]|uniref:Uncharacterized protein n=1 Tax=Bifidobacterium thermophilum RBL67 TaxID=1254439 RepID=M4RD29_9BIFI|nr:hypothetical protein D805_0156 [Bifidobacterium thermophilum RBL67]
MSFRGRWLETCVAAGAPVCDVAGKREAVMRQESRAGLSRAERI